MKRANFTTESMILLTIWRGIGKGIDFMVQPGRPKGILKELLLLDSEKNNRSFQNYGGSYIGVL